MNTTLAILSTHWDLPITSECMPQAPLRDCSFRMKLAPDDPKCPIVSIDGGIACTAGVWHFYGYFGSERRQCFSVPIDPNLGSGEIAQLLAAVLAPTS